jgi:hypothetical protein
MVEINLGSFKQSAREALYTFFTPVRVLFLGFLWGWNKIAGIFFGRSRIENQPGKETKLHSQG